MESVIYTDFTKSLYRITPYIGQGVTDLYKFEIQPDQIAAGNTVNEVFQDVGNYRNGKKNFTNTDSGYILGVDNGIAKFYIGDPTNYFNWTGTALNISGALSAGSIDIGGSDATSFHVDTDGNMWLGAATYAASTARISNAGVALLQSGTIGGWTLSSTQFSSASAFIDSSVPSIGLGTVTDYLTGTGFWVGLNTLAYKLHIGNPAAEHMKWDGTNLTVTGTIVSTTATIASTTTDTFTINSDLTDSNVDLIFGRTTGGNATMRYAGTNISFDKTIVPSSDGGISLGTTALGYAGLHMNTGSAINWENGDVTVTHAANTLTFAGATSGYLFEDGSIGSSGNLTIAPAGDVVFDPTGNDILPNTGYDLNIGSLSKKYLTLHAAELWVETLVAQNTIATIGGRILVGPTTTLTRDLTAIATTIYVKHNEMASGDRAYMEANGSVEFFAITSAATLEVAGDYSYTVTRNLDGTGANAWSAGDAMFNTGAAGDGFIDIYSVAGVKAGTEAGPTIVGNVRNSATYNDWTSHWAIGNLNGLYGYGATTYGVALGEYAASRTHITLDSTDGLRFFNGTATVIGQWSTAGNISVGNTASEHVYITSTAVQMKDGATVYTDLTAGTLTLGLATTEHVVVSSTSVQILDNATVYTDLTAGTLTLGVSTTEHVVINSTSVQILDNATVYTDLTAGALSLGDTANEHTLINTSGVALKDGANVYALFAATTTIGLTASEHISISSTSVQIKDGATVYTDLTAGALLLGQTGASQSNVYVTAGALYLRNNTTSKITLAADGTAFFSGAVTVGDGATTSGTITLNHFNTGGDTYLAGGTINAAAWTANPGFILGIDDSDSDKVKFYLGDTTSHVDYNVTTANTLTVVGAITATSGAIAAFTLAATTLSATNLVLTSGAANTANISVGTGSNLAGMNSGNSGTDIAFWAGDTFANRATADFRVNLQGDVVATSIVAPVTFVATDTLLKSADTERNTSTDTDYVLKKEISVTNGGGTFRIKFDIHGTGAPAPRGAYAKIYRNGVAVGTERVDTTGVYQTFSEDISGWKSGDLIQLYLKTYQNGDNAFCRNFRIYGDVYYFTVNTD